MNTSRTNTTKKCYSDMHLIISWELQDKRVYLNRSWNYYIHHGQWYYYKLKK